MSADQGPAEEAAQNVVDSVNSWHGSAETETVRDALDEGLREADVELPQQQREEVVEDIAEGGETSAPQVHDAEPAESDDA